MKIIWCLATGMVMLSCSLSSAQDLFYGAYQVSAPVLISQPVVVPMSYVPQYPIAYAAPVYVQPAPVFVQPTAVYYGPTVVPAPVVVAPAMSVAHSPYSVAARETARATRNGIDYSYREYGPFGGQRYRYTVNSRPYGYVVRERGR